MNEKIENKEKSFEITFFEGVLKRSPNFTQALIALGDLYTKEGFYDEGLDTDLRLSQLRSDDPIILYNLACSYSILNQVDLALRTIKKAVKKGYEDFTHLENDKDLGNLLKDIRFKKYLLRIKKNKQVRP